MSRALALALVLVVAGCEPPFPSPMRDQPRLDPWERDPRTGAPVARHPPDGTVPRAPRAGAPAPEGLALLRLGREVHEVRCAPCHGLDGAGRGPVVRRGFPAPPSWHAPEVRGRTDAHLVRVVRDGLGKMPAYGREVPPLERRAVVAYIRALQRSQRATLADVPPEVRRRLEAERP